MEQFSPHDLLKPLPISMYTFSCIWLEQTNSPGMWRWKGLFKQEFNWTDSSVRREGRVSPRQWGVLKSI